MNTVTLQSGLTDEEVLQQYKEKQKLLAKDFRINVLAPMQSRFRYNTRHLARKLRPAVDALNIQEEYKVQMKDYNTKLRAEIIKLPQDMRGEFADDYKQMNTWMEELYHTFTD